MEKKVIGTKFILQKKTEALIFDEDPNKWMHLYYQISFFNQRFK